YFSITKNGEFASGKWGKDEGKIEKVDVTNYYDPTAEKSINEGLDELAINRGEEFTYNIKVNLPSDIKSYKNFTITDHLDKNLEYAGSWSVDGAKDNAFRFSQKGQKLT